MLSKGQIKDRTTEITLRRHNYDQLYMELQSLLAAPKAAKVHITKLRHDFHDLIAKLREAVRDNTEELDRLRYRSDKLKLEGEDMDSAVRNIESLKQYFGELSRKVKLEQTKGEEKISERERWELSQHDQYNLDEESQLIMSANAARESKNMAGEVLSSLQNQGSRLGAAREKMSEVLKGINLSGNVVHLIKTRSREDNKLIMMLTLGLLLEIFICVQYLRPWLRGK